MSQLLETIKIVDGIPQNLFYHNKRFNETRAALFSLKEPLDLSRLIKVPPEFQKGIVKCRCVYGADKIEFEFLPYKIRPLKSVSLVEGGAIHYSYKFADRNYFEELKKQAAGDDIIITKEGMITDASYANLIFFDGARWVTPANPLLKGTMRQKLLEERKIIQYIITDGMIRRFKSFKLINSMMDMDESPELPVAIIQSK